SLYQDETSRQCQWHLPEAHFLESWSDTRAFDGTASIVQPLIEPLFNGRSAHEVLAVLTNQIPTPGYEIVRSYWRDLWSDRKSFGSFDEFWQTAVHDGIVPDTAFRAKSVSLKEGWRNELQDAVADAPGEADGGYEIVFQPDPTIYDGR